MIATLAIWAYIAALSWTYGRLTLHGLRRVAGASGAAPLSSGIVALVGLVTISTLTSALALVAPIGLGANLALVVLAVSLTLPVRDRLRASLRCHLDRLRQTPPIVLALLATSLLVVLARTVVTLTNYDTALYHAPAIRWLEEYGTVPGLGNLHSRFGFSATWFGPGALFSFAPLSGRSFHVHNGALFALFLVYAFGGFRDWSTGRQLSAVAKLACGLAGVLVFWPQLSSPTPDVAAAVFVWAAGLLFLEKAEDRRGAEIDGRTFAIVLLASYAVAVKLSAGPILLLPAYLILRVALRRPRVIPVLCGLAVVTLVPYFVRTTLDSGYPIYPFPGLDPVQVDWKVPMERVVDDYRWARSWARIPRLHPDQVLNMAPAEWVPIWLGRFPPFEKGAFVAILALGPLWTLSLLRSLLSRHLPSHLVDRAVLFGAACLGVTFWFEMAPDARFSWGFLILASALLVAWALQPLLRHLPARGLAVGYAMLLACVLGAASGGRDTPPPPLGELLVLPADYPVHETRVVEFANFGGLAPRTGDQCGYTPFPCTPQPSIEVEMRGPTFKDGFRRRDR
jgi:hypothetical protein